MWLYFIRPIIPSGVMTSVDVLVDSMPQCGVVLGSTLCHRSSYHLVARTVVEVPILDVVTCPRPPAEIPAADAGSFERGSRGHTFNAS